MGLIEEGTVKGNLPSKEVFAVHYPGYPSSMSRAVETLGGLDAIAKARISMANKLELHFRPEDPFSHPAFGQISTCNSLLLRISKSNTGGAQNSGSSGSQSEGHGSKNTETDSSSDVSADIVARVQKAYHFNGMVDYQHVLPVHANVGRSKERMNEAKELVDTEDVDDEDDDNVMILVPPLFSLKDIPEDIMLKSSITLSSKKKQEGVVRHCWEMEIEPCLAIDFNIKEIPKKVNWEQYIPKESDQWKLQMTVSQLFDERPIWPRRSVLERLINMGFKVGEHMLKRLLFRSAYYFGSGPFRRFWIRKGYDPRKNSDSRLYQRMDFRVPVTLRGYCDANVGMKQAWEDLCAFRVFPYKCQICFQLFELLDDYIQEEIRRTPNQSVCSCSTGWFSAYVLDKFKKRVVVRFISVYPFGGTESLLKSYSEKFEKSKKTRFQVNFPSPGEGSEPLENRDSNHEEDKADDINDNEVEEEDEGEDEMDLDDPTYLGGDDSDFFQDRRLRSASPFKRCSYTENISKNYLQELFGSFPTKEGEPNQLHGAECETEYEIYEQDSDANNSDDD